MSLAEDGKSTALLSVDTGGTFTDVILLHDGERTVLKLPSTPEDPSLAVVAGIEKILAGREVPAFLLIHGSTVATNALLERKGARVLLVTNEGFEDVLEIGRQTRPQLYALTGHRLSPLVDRDDRIGIGGRLDFAGSELVPLHTGQLAELPERLKGAEAVAVVLLHSYANPAHEERVAQAISHLGVPLSVSSHILPEFREFERTSTTVANAYVAPLMARYLGHLRDGLKNQRIRVMGSSGGALPLERAITEPIHTVLSGPAGGVVGALDWGKRCGAEHLLSFDMGGTSTDVGLIPGTLLQTREGKVGDTPISIPLLDIHTVGAGGGSIARVDPGGALKVGPESAGAMPGPVAYGRGGMVITVTDAHVWLGRIPVEGFLGGAMRLDRSALTQPMQSLAEAAGTTPNEVAEGIVDVVNASMERALRVISVERGVDPADFHLLAFGGAAGLHAAELTERLGLRGALIPPDPGLLSAYGMLVAPVVRESSRTTFLSSARPEDVDRTAGILADLEKEARSLMTAEGLARDQIASSRWVDARYEDQGFELRVPAEAWVEGFHQAHQDRYGYRRDAVPVQAVTLRVRLEAPGGDVRVIPVKGPDAPHRATRRTVVWRGDELEAQILRREDLVPGESVLGPAVLLEYSSTTWCPPGWTVARDHLGALRMTPLTRPS